MARHLERSHPVSASLPPGDRSWVDPGRKSDEVMSEIRGKIPHFFTIPPQLSTVLAAYITG